MLLPGRDKLILIPSRRTGRAICLFPTNRIQELQLRHLWKHVEKNDENVLIIYEFEKNICFERPTDIIL